MRTHCLARADPLLRTPTQQHKHSTEVHTCPERHRDSEMCRENSACRQTKVVMPSSSRLDRIRSVSASSGPAGYAPADEGGGWGRGWNACRIAASPSPSVRSIPSRSFSNFETMSSILYPDPSPPAPTSNESRSDDPVTPGRRATVLQARHGGETGKTVLGRHERHSNDVLPAFEMGMRSMLWNPGAVRPTRRGSTPRLPRSPLSAGKILEACSCTSRGGIIQISMYCFTSPDNSRICAIARGRTPGNSEGGGPAGELGIFEGPLPQPPFPPQPPALWGTGPKRPVVICRVSIPRTAHTISIPCKQAIQCDIVYAWAGGVCWSALCPSQVPVVDAPAHSAARLRGGAGHHEGLGGQRPAHRLQG